MMLEPAISVLHHHAPRGGLRAHGARVVTYASSRRRITHRHLPEVTEVYRSLRYFSPVQVHEALVQSAVARSVRTAALFEERSSSFTARS